jgi:UDP-N-acetylglucosamine 2-epimerase
VPGRVVTTGDIARDTLQRHLRLAPTQSVPRPFALVTLHRAALTSDPDALRVVLDALGELDMAIVFPVHPRTRGALDRFGLLSRVPPTVTLIPPLGYLETIATVRDAEVVITDSGGLQREAYWLGTPCVTLRSETEWVETLECGANTLVDPPSAGGLLTRTVADQRQRRRTRPWTPDAYGDGRAAPNIVQAVGRFLGVDPAR